ncbi:MAG: TonB-dependent receptor plug domain-containing protein, partial [Bacteroidales bacterium]|nr:TonB-dependent receptor plug domain-containing protein [Bacteroidales bacterium]
MRYIWITALFLILAQYTYAQEAVTVKGTVTNNEGQPLAAAVVMENGTTNGASTGPDGTYTIMVKEGAVLTVSYIGYSSVEKKLGKGQTTMDFILAEDNLFLTETVVVGYGTQKKVNLTSAISVIDNDEIKTTTGTGIVTKLQGKVAGLNIRQMSSEPGSYDNSVNIRNFGTPIYIIDGIQRTTSDFNRLNSEDIESISVLKDASAAIYGLNASNGVVIVTTKQGSDGKTRFKFNANVGFSSPTSLVEMTDAYGYYTL